MLDKIPEPYDTMLDTLSTEEIIQLADKLKGKEYYFRQYEYEQSEIFELLKSCIDHQKADIVYRLFIGNKIYFPNIRTDKLNAVQREYNGYNAMQLSTKYGYSERHIRRIARNTNKFNSSVADRQLRLF